jgi:hypothetical protein
MKNKRDEDIELKDVVTHEDKIRYSKMMWRRWNEAAETGRPSAFLDRDRFPLEDPTKPWMSPEWHIMIEQAERAKARLQRKRAKHE